MLQQVDMKYKKVDAAAGGSCIELLYIAASLHLMLLQMGPAEAAVHDCCLTFNV